MITFHTSPLFTFQYDCSRRGGGVARLEEHHFTLRPVWGTNRMMKIIVHTHVRKIERVRFRLDLNACSGVPGMGIPGWVAKGDWLDMDPSEGFRAEFRTLGGQEYITSPRSLSDDTRKNAPATTAVAALILLNAPLFWTCSVWHGKHEMIRLGIPFSRALHDVDARRDAIPDTF